MDDNRGPQAARRDIQVRPRELEPDCDLRRQREDEEPVLAEVGEGTQPEDIKVRVERGGGEEAHAARADVRGQELDKDIFRAGQQERRAVQI